MASSALRLAALCAVLALAAAAIPSNGLRTVETEREKLSNADYNINPRNGVAVRTPGFTAYLAEIPKFKALGTADVQFGYADIMLKSGQTFPTHYHPRGAEILTVLHGAAQVTFTMENGRKVSNRIGWSRVTVIPQGLPHTIKCVSKQNCRMIATLNSAKAGTVFL